MPQQELFYEQKAGDRRVEVIKTYDRSYAREAFLAMDRDALRMLATALDIEANYDPSEIPVPDGA